MNNKDVVVQNVDRRHFNYQKGNVQLSFSLRTDIKGEIKGFIELMELALPDLQATLAEVEAKQKADE